VAFSEGFDDYSTARVRLEVVGGEPTVTVHTAAAEVGQGLVTVEQQICRTELGVDRVVVAPKDTRVGSGGSTSASRQTYVTGGAIQEACRRVRTQLLEAAADRLATPVAELSLTPGAVRGPHGSTSLVDVLGGVERSELAGRGAAPRGALRAGARRAGSPHRPRGPGDGDDGRRAGARP
jgi:CO/xanthine dehydrogenase Mo-binding subunit